MLTTLLHIFFRLLMVGMASCLARSRPTRSDIHRAVFGCRTIPLDQQVAGGQDQAATMGFMVEPRQQIEAGLDTAAYMGLTAKQHHTAGGRGLDADRGLALEQLSVGGREPAAYRHLMLELLNRATRPKPNHEINYW